MAFSLPILPALALTLLTLLAVYKLVIFPFFLHPLQHVPSAHWSIPLFGDSWILYQRFWSKNNAVTYVAHQKHGSVVRLGRNELSVNCVDDGIRTIYAGGWEKHKWYPQNFASYGVINMFSTMHHAPHSQKKRTLANIYSKSYIAASPQVAANSKTLLTTRILPLLQSLSETGTPQDVHGLNNAFTMDFMSAYQFGLSQSTNFTQQVELRKRLLHEYHSRRDYEVYSAEMPWLKSWSRAVGLSVVPLWVDHANKLLEDWNSDMCIAADKYLAQTATKSDDYAGNDPVVYKQYKAGLTKLRAKDENGGKEFNHQVMFRSGTRTDASCDDEYATAEIHSEMLDHLGAGHETSAIALTYLYWEMSKRPQLQKELRDELQSLDPQIRWPLPPNTDLNTFDLPEPKQIDALPLLHAIMMEVLRLHAPIPGFEPRISPQVAGGSTLGAYSNIPGGVRVSSMPYTLHRNPAVFPDPESFIPSRWLSSHTSEEHLKEMHRWFWAFGSGGRMCIGSHLAIQEMKLLVAAIYSNWMTEIVDDEGIEAIDAYTVKPHSNQLMLRFSHV